MPELPETYCRAREMDEHLAGLTVHAIEVLQPKCLNVPVEAFEAGLVGATIEGTTYRGKWLVTDTSRGHLLINLGMGGELLLVRRNAMPEKWRIRLDVDAGRSLSVNFWWFGNAHYVDRGCLSEHAMTAKLGPNALDVTGDELRKRLSGRRGGIKSFLLNQSNIAGIGNAYIHDILFRAGLHPLRTIATLRDDDVERLGRAIHDEFQRSIAKGAASYELNLFGQPGGFGADDLQVGYRDGQPCPTCGTVVEKLKTGSTTSYVCPRCQPLSGP